MFQQALDLRQGLGGGVLGQQGADVRGARLEVVHGLLVGPRDAAGLDAVQLGDQSVGLVGQLPDHHVPVGEALVAPLAVGEGSRVSTGADVAARPGRPLHAHAAAAGFVALLLGGAPGVAVTGWRTTGQFSSVQTIDTTY